MPEELADGSNGPSPKVVASVDETESTTVNKPNDAEPQSKSPVWLTLTLFRHGQCLNNIIETTKKYYENENEDVLTPAGIAQAQELGKKFAKVHFDSVLCSPLKRAVQTMEYLTELIDVVPALSYLEKAFRFHEQDHGPEYRKLMRKGFWQDANRLRMPSYSSSNFRDHKAYRGESLTDVEQRCALNIGLLMIHYAKGIPENPEGLDDESRSRDSRICIAKLPGHQKCQPDTLPASIPHVGVVSHNILLTEMLEALLSWHSESHITTDLAFRNADWARVVLRWDPSDEKATISERSARDIRVILPGRLDVWFLRAPTGWY
ncbi:hypothetical protein A0H81_15022 [Grifola frondosa]|uniref:Uncharacterized protein n=1 Tax=Grifola frondosa TaxID=5627 RepID=A0A1C7LJ60_GRIFR|nr:hypothetical protein A0H81_15022 [Grifola frondosa]